MEFIDLGRQYELISHDLHKRMKKTLDSRKYIMGPSVLEMEERLAAFCGRKYCLSCASGTDALVIPLMAWGLEKTDAVFVPSFTFFASAESVVLAGGTPVFVDSDSSFNISPEALECSIKKVLREGKLRPRGIIPVDLFGLSADYDAIIPIAKKYGLFVLEDAAQGFGGSLNGKRNGSFGDVSATSFFPAKPLGCYGDGGAIFTDDDKLYEIMRSIRVHGQGSDKYDNVRIGLNGRMDSIQADVILSKLAVFEEELEKRQKVAGWYNKRLTGLLPLPSIPENYYSAWAQYTLLAKDIEQRQLIIDELKKQDIPVMVYYPIPLHMQTAFAYLGVKPEELPVCRSAADCVFSLPMSPYITEEEVNAVCDALIAVLSAK